jgi:hypothetical protein
LTVGEVGGCEAMVPFCDCAGGFCDDGGVRFAGILPGGQNGLVLILAIRGPYLQI